MRRFTIPFLIFIFSLFIAGSAFAALPRVEYVEGEVMAVLEIPQDIASDPGSAAFKSALSASASRSAASAGAQAVSTYSAIAASSGKNIVHMRGEGKSTEELIAALERLPEVISVTPNYIFRKTATPNDTRYGELWGMTKINAPAAWDVSTGSAAVFVAVLDTGIDYTHPDIAANMGVDSLANRGIDTINNDNDPMDDDAADSHGTHVAGTIGAVGNNNEGVTGVNWTVSLLGVKVLDDQGSGSGASIIGGLNYVVAQKNAGINIRVANMSLGGWMPIISNPDTDPYGAAHKAVSDAGILLVVASGNEGQNIDSHGTLRPYPASFQFANMITVGSIDSGDSISSFSNYSNTFVHLAAPGSNILSTTIGNNYASISGTSMACPHVAGAAALIAAAHPGNSAGQIKSRIVNNTTANSNLTGKMITGGHLNLAAAITGTAPAVPVTGVSLSPSSHSMAIGDTVTLTATVTPDSASDKSVTWSSSNTDVATVSDGTVTAVARGSAVITVRTNEGAFSASCSVNVSAGPPAPTTTPVPPAPVSPIDGEENVSMTPRLRASAYSHPSGLPHNATRWQISTSPSFSSSEETEAASAVVFDHTSSTALLEIHVPAGTLAPRTTYYWRTSFQDSGLAWSGWSDARRFTTASSVHPPTPDRPGTSSSGCSAGAAGAISVVLLLPLLAVLRKK